MSLEISVTPYPSSRIQHLDLQDGESLQVFSGGNFKIRNSENVAQLVPLDKDLQIVCHDGTSYLLKNFLEVDFVQEPQLALQDGDAVTWHDFAQQTDGIDTAFNLDDNSNPTLAFAPLHVIASISESQKWGFTRTLPNEDDHAEAVAQELATAEEVPIESNVNEPAEEGSPSKAAAQNVEPAAESNSTDEFGASQTGDAEVTTSTASNSDFIEIDIRKFLDIDDNGSNSPPVITAVIVGNDTIEIEIDNDTAIVRLPKNIFEDNDKIDIRVTIDDGGNPAETTITIIETKDGGGETFHLLLSQNRVAENDEGALIGKLDTDDSGNAHTYEYTLSEDSSNSFEIVGNVIKLKDGVSIDYESHPDSYSIRVTATDETGHRIEQSMDIWPEDVNEIASVSSIETATLEDVRVTFDPDDFDTAFDDEDNDYLEMVRIDSLPENGTLSLGDDPVIVGQLIDYDQIEELSFQPNANWNGGTVFQWSGFDGQAWSAESSPVSISIEAVNDAPVVSVTIGQQVAETDDSFSMDLPEDAFVDVDAGDTLQYSADLPEWLSIDPQTGALSGTPSGAELGDHDITITATDSQGESASQSFRISVENTNQPPTFTSIPNAQTDEDVSFSLDTGSYFDDADISQGDQLSFSAQLEDGSDLPNWLSLDPENGLLSGTPENEDVGDLRIQITASDAELKAEQTFSLQVDNTNDAPTVIANIAAQTTDEDAVFKLDTSTHLTDEDQGDELSYSATLENGDPLPDWLSIDSETGQLSGIPDNEDATFNFDVSTNFSDQDIGDSLTFTAERTNESGTIGNDTITTGSGNDAIDGGKQDDTITIDYGVSAGGEGSGSNGGSGSGSGGGSGSGSGGASDFGTFDGGEGEDMLEFDGSDLQIDLTALDNGAIQNIERLDIDGSGHNSLRLSSDDVLGMTDADNKLFIDGGSDDHVEISNDFQIQDVVAKNEAGYTHYYDAWTEAHLYINNNVTDLDTF